MYSNEYSSAHVWFNQLFKKYTYMTILWIQNISENGQIADYLLYFALTYSMSNMNIDCGSRIYGVLGTFV